MPLGVPENQGVEGEGPQRGPKVSWWRKWWWLGRNLGQQHPLGFTGPLPKEPRCVYTSPFFLGMDQPVPCLVFTEGTQPKVTWLRTSFPALLTTVPWDYTLGLCLRLAGGGVG